MHIKRGVHLNAPTNFSKQALDDKLCCDFQLHDVRRALVIALVIALVVALVFGKGIAADHERRRCNLQGDGNALPRRKDAHPLPRPLRQIQTRNRDDRQPTDSTRRIHKTFAVCGQRIFILQSRL